MSFISKGSTIIGSSNSSSGLVASSILKRLKDDGSYESYNWGSEVSKRLSSPISRSTWSETGAYKYLSLGMFRQTYTTSFNFERDRRFRAITEIALSVLPATETFDSPTLICGLVKGAIDADQAVILKTLVDEYLLQQYTNVIALGKMSRYLSDSLYSTDINSTIKKYEGDAEVVQDYSLSTNEAVYFIVAAVEPSTVFTNITSLTLSVYSGDYQEFVGNMQIPTNTVGASEVRREYRPELARTNLMLKIGAGKYVEDETYNNLIISSDICPELREDGIYNVAVNVTDLPTSTLPIGISLGYYDDTSELFVRDGEIYPVKTSAGVAVQSSSVNSKYLTLYFDGTNFIILNTVSMS